MEHFVTLRDACVVERAVEPTVRREHLLHHARDAVLVGYIGLDEQCLAPLRDDLLDRLRAALLVAVGHGYLSAGGCE